MKITVKLFGTLQRDFPGYDSGKGLSVELPDGASIGNLLARLNIPEAKGYFISMNNAIAKPDDKLVDNTTVMILQALAGG